MKYGIIDIGSNTIHTVVYECRGKKINVILDEFDNAHLYDYVKNGVMTRRGIILLEQSVAEALNQCRLTKTDKVICMATAALRGAENKEEIIEEVERECGVRIEILTGEQEAEYDYWGINMMYSFDGGAAFDLGGGSCQLFTFSKDTIIDRVSLPLGTRRLYNEFFKDDCFPTRESIDNMYNHIINCLSEYSEMKNGGYDCIYAIGGTCRSLVPLVSELNHRRLQKGKAIIEYDDMINLIRMVVGEYVTFTKLAKSVSPKRVNTMMSGIVAIVAICNFFDVKKISVVSCGVREGILYKRFLYDGK